MKASSITKCQYEVVDLMICLRFRHKFVVFPLEFRKDLFTVLLVLLQDFDVKPKRLRLFESSFHKQRQ